MSDLYYTMMTVINEGHPEDLEKVLPLDLSGYCEREIKDIYGLYIAYGTNPERVRLCAAKLEEVGADAGRSDSI